MSLVNCIGNRHFSVPSKAELLLSVTPSSSLYRFLTLSPCATRNLHKTPVHLAALRGNFEVLEYLVADFQASTTIRDKNGCTPLMLAVKKEQYKTEWVLRRLGSRNTWELIAGIGLSRLKNKT